MKTSPRDKFRAKSFILIMEVIGTNLIRSVIVYKYAEEQRCEAIETLMKEYPSVTYICTNHLPKQDSFSTPRCEAIQQLFLCLMAKKPLKIKINNWKQPCLNTNFLHLASCTQKVISCVAYHFRTEFMILLLTNQ